MASAFPPPVPKSRFTLVEPPPGLDDISPPIFLQEQDASLRRTLAPPPPPPPPSILRTSSSAPKLINISVSIPPPPGLLSSNSSGQSLVSFVGDDDDSSFTSSATSHCACENCKSGKRSSRHIHLHSSRRRKSSKTRPRSLSRRTIETIFFPVSSCIAT